jgi:hypothetical protein
MLAVAYAAGRVTLAGQVDGDGPDKERHPQPQSVMCGLP